MMRARDVRHFWLGALAAFPCAVGCPSVQAQSLADVARAEAERRKGITRPARIYTNKDLKPVRSATGSGPADRSGTAPEPRPPKADRDERSSSSGGAVEGEEARERGESWWRQRMADARGRAERSHMFAEALQSRANALTADFAARDDPAARAAVRTELDKTLAELERMRGDIAEQEHAISELEEEARRAGVPPGWLR
jgi:hypothetical protein